MSDIATDAKAWFDANWDPEITLGEWWDRLGRSGYGFPTWPADAFGKGLSSDDARAVNEIRAEAGAHGPPSGIGPMMGGPTVAEHGTPEQIQRFLPDLVTGKHIWCQLFSEPGSGSDLASLQTKAVRDGDEWIVNGQKVWTSGAQYSKWGMLIARTNPDVPKHEGITYFMIDMEQPGVEVRPLKEMTGGATFNEVFFSDARVPHENVIGEVNHGWSVAVTTLSFERKSLGAGGMSNMAGGGAMLGISIGGEGGPATPDLTQRVGDLVNAGGGAMGGMGAMGADMFKLIPMMFGKQGDALVRQDLARLYTLMEISRYTGLRSKAAAERGDAPGPEMSTGKLMISNLMRLMRDFMLGLEGASGMLAGSNAPLNGMAQWITLFSPAISIAGGTDEIQRNIIGERVLGLPPEPRPDKDAAFKDLLVGTQR
ncbi:MAG TPA: acyl-CoA dehydrogenase family protein [Acidimicrobiales bacterium]|nr:acyl-CoA dehydrogenase family protein [Acidimicrobiales bacterium]